MDDDDGIARHAFEGAAVFVLHRHLIEEIEQASGEPIPDLVVSDNVEERDNLARIRDAFHAASVAPPDAT
jgi:hypothetical protein